MSEEGIELVRLNLNLWYTLLAYVIFSYFEYEYPWTEGQPSQRHISRVLHLHQIHRNCPQRMRTSLEQARVRVDHATHWAQSLHDQSWSPHQRLPPRKLQRTHQQGRIIDYLGPSGILQTGRDISVDSGTVRVFERNNQQCIAIIM